MSGADLALTWLSSKGTPCTRPSRRRYSGHLGDLFTFLHYINRSFSATSVSFFRKLTTFKTSSAHKANFKANSPAPIPTAAKQNMSFRHTLPSGTPQRLPNSSLTETMFKSPTTILNLGYDCLQIIADNIPLYEVPKFALARRDFSNASQQRLRQGRAIAYKYKTICLSNRRCDHEGCRCATSRPEQLLADIAKEPEILPFIKVIDAGEHDHHNYRRRWHNGRPGLPDIISVPALDELYKEAGVERAARDLHVDGSAHEDTYNELFALLVLLLPRLALLRFTTSDAMKFVLKWMRRLSSKPLTTVDYSDDSEWLSIPLAHITRLSISFGITTPLDTLHYLKKASENELAIHTNRTLPLFPGYRQTIHCAVADLVKHLP